MKTTIIFVFGLTLLSNPLISQNLNCSSLKNITYGLKDSSYTITRTGNKQIITDASFDTLENCTIEYHVIWVSNCAYKLDFTQVLEYVSTIDIGFPYNYLITIDDINDSTITEIWQITDPRFNSSVPLEKEWVVFK
jgi:hypothetical protein